MEGNTGDSAPAQERTAGKTKDPNGAPVVLLERLWTEKVLRGHPEMTSLVHEVLEAVNSADCIELDPVRGDRSRYFKRGVGPSQWIVVVVSYEQEPARIISAFAQRKDPPSWSA